MNSVPQCVSGQSLTIGFQCQWPVVSDWPVLLLNYTQSWLGNTEYRNTSAVVSECPVFLLNHTKFWLRNTEYRNTAPVVSDWPVLLLNYTQFWLGNTEYRNTAPVVSECPVFLNPTQFWAEIQKHGPSEVPAHINIFSFMHKVWYTFTMLLSEITNQTF